MKARLINKIHNNKIKTKINNKILMNIQFKRVAINIKIQIINKIIKVIQNKLLNRNKHN